jgi:hypothetical protein
MCDVGDTHFGHVGILDMAIRLYADIRAYDRDQIDQRAGSRGPSRLASRGFCRRGCPLERAEEVFRKLNGILHLIRGNHDGDEICEKLPWASVDVMRSIVGSDGRKVVLCHYPSWNGRATTVGISTSTAIPMSVGRRTGAGGTRGRSAGVPADDVRSDRRADEGAAGRGVVLQVARSSCA